MTLWVTLKVRFFLQDFVFPPSNSTEYYFQFVHGTWFWLLCNLKYLQGRLRFYSVSIQWNYVLTLYNYFKVFFCTPQSEKLLSQLKLCNLLISHLNFRGGICHIYDRLPFFCKSDLIDLPANFCY